jgi:hypothetical protein
MKAFSVTYEIVTPESAEQGHYADMGYVLPGGWHGNIANTPEDREAVLMDLRSARSLVDGGLEDCGRWFRQTSSDTDYRTGAEETRSLHPPRTITKASYARLKRLLTRR